MRNRSVRLIAAALALAFVAALPSFLRHARFFLSGSVDRLLITGNWVLVAVNVAFFLGFLAFLHYRRSLDWTSVGGYSVYSAFIVSLFIEMYGLPLTIFLGSGLVSAPAEAPAYLFGVEVLDTTIGLTAWYLVGLGITGLGMLLVAAGWYQVYRSDGLVTDGLYRYSRNPQYVGIILIALGWVIGWPTVLTLALFPLVVYAYYRLARTESAEMLEEHGDAYAAYRDRVPLLI
ncbi:MAG: isoprenylcysteine carboxylmethyltransferase family protein [Candidatus Nanohaloarchaea archaeon]|nr:isoprenylcysteine carboxylmethyltransferase family protein [Candidatus Nanohaloarchaea archaeon]